MSNLARKMEKKLIKDYKIIRYLSKYYYYKKLLYKLSSLYSKYSIVYKSLRINHLNNVLSLENEVYDDEGLIEKSDRWKEFIDSIR